MDMPAMKISIVSQYSQKQHLLICRIRASKSFSNWLRWRIVMTIVKSYDIYVLLLCLSPLYTNLARYITIVKIYS